MKRMSNLLAAVGMAVVLCLPFGVEHWNTVKVSNGPHPLSGQPR